MPASPRATAAIEAIASCVPDASTIGAATGLSQVVIGSQNGVNWMKPPTSERTASTDTGQTIESGPSRRPWLSCRCSSTNAERSPPKTTKKSRKM